MLTTPVQQFLPWALEDFQRDFYRQDSAVHVWLAELDQSQEHTRRLAQVLPADDQARAGSYRYARDRRRFTVARAYLRIILGLYIGDEPGSLDFVYGQYGKPAVSSPHADGLRFSVSRSHELALYAIAHNREIGVDIERLSPLPEHEMDDIVRYCFSPGEQITWLGLPAHQKHQAFFNCWTRKEAYVKATGAGLSQPLDQFDVTLAPPDPPRLQAVGGNTTEAGRWSLETLWPHPCYAAALMVQGFDWRIACFSASTAIS